MSEEPTDDTASVTSSDGSPPTIPPDAADVHPAPAEEAAESAMPIETPAPPETHAADGTTAAAERAPIATEAVEAVEGVEPAAQAGPAEASEALQPAAAEVGLVDASAAVQPPAAEVAPDGAAVATATADEAAQQPAMTAGRRGSRWRPAALVMLLFLIAIALGFATAFMVPRLADVPAPSQGALASSPPPAPAATPSATVSHPPPTGSPLATPSASATPRASSLVYVVQRGDILSDIAARYGVTVAAIVAANGLKDANHIEPGQHLIIPVP